MISPQSVSSKSVPVIAQVLAMRLIFFTVAHMPSAKVLPSEVLLRCALNVIFPLVYRSRVSISKQIPVRSDSFWTTRFAFSGVVTSHV